MVTIEREDFADGLSIKRCYLPFKVSCPCPECGTVCTVDLTEQYLSFPVPGGIEEIYFHCRDDDTEWPCKVLFDVTLEVVND